VAIFKCESCGYEREVPEKLLGKKAKCPDCGHGVTIVEEVSDSDDFFEESFEGEGVTLGEPSDAGADGGKGSGPIDLDGVEGDPDFEPEDIVCVKCGEVVKDDGQETCPVCGASLQRAEEFPDLSEDDVDVSDLADSSEPQVWDEAFKGDGGGDGSLEDDDVSPDRWRFFEGSLPLNIFGGLVSGVLNFFFAVALAMLVASQEGMNELLPYVVAASLIGVTVGSIFYSFGTRIPFSLVGPESVIMTVLLLFVGAIYRDMSGYTQDVILSTILAAIALTAFLVGATIWIIGRMKVGEYVRYVPLQIIGGVIGGVGVFVLLGVMDWCADFPMDWRSAVLVVRDWAAQFDSGICLYAMGPAVVFGVILFAALSRYKNSLFLLAVILAAAGAGYGAGFWGQDQIVQSLAAPVPYMDTGRVMFPLDVLRSGLGAVQWDIIRMNSLYIGAVAALIILTTMYRVTRLELIRCREADLDREYRTLGLVNMLSALCGGTPVSLSYGRSAGNYASGGRGPVAGVVAGLVCGAGLYFADVAVTLIPMFVFEGLLIYIGLDLIRDWLFKTKSAFTRRDDLWMLWMTFLLTITMGLLEGIGFGVALALMVTVSRNSRRGPIRNVLSGANHRSNVDRAPAQQRTLKEVGDHIHIIRLQGFIFLGSMQSLLRDLRKRLDDRDKLRVQFLLLDFRMVAGFASASGVGFEKLRSIAEEYDVEIILTSVPLELEEHLEEMGHVGESQGMFKVFFNLDFALEWCENHVLDSENMLEMKLLTLPELLAPVFPEPKYIPALMKVLKRVDLAKGEAAFRQGDVSDSMYFVESGRLDVELELEGGKLLRLKKVGPGAVFGEMGLFTSAPRSATVRATEKCVLYKMSKEKLEAVEKRAPMLVTAINRYLINMMSDRLMDANIKVRDLMM
jgi:SulP family sulfate permease